MNNVINRPTDNIQQKSDKLTLLRKVINWQ